MSSPRLCIQLLLISSAKCRFFFFFFQGIDNMISYNVISFVLCGIFGCRVLSWWTDNPVPAVIFSACHRCCFSILKRAGTLWSFDSAQQGRAGQPAEVPNLHKRFKEQLWKIDFCVLWVVFFFVVVCFLFFCFSLSLWLVLFHLPALYYQVIPNTHPHTSSMRTGNENLNSYRKWDFGEKLILHIKSLKAGRCHPVGVDRPPALLPKERNVLFQLFPPVQPLFSAWFLPATGSERPFSLRLHLGHPAFFSQ